MRNIISALFFCAYFLSNIQSIKAQGIEFKVELLSDGITYRVSMKPSTTWTAPNNNTLGAQVTLVVATGGFQVNNLTSINGTWDKLPTIVAPAERPSKDYIVVYLASSTTLPYTTNVETPLFTFQNTGVCTGILDLIHNDSDPFMPPNAQNFNVGNYITTRGGGGSSINLWKGNYGTVADCRSCQIEYKLTPLSTGKYQVSMIPKTTWSGALATTSTQQITIVAPTGGFQASNLYSLVSGVTYAQTSRFNAPTENSAKDYIVFTLQNLGTTNLTYAANVEVPLFTFNNTGNCTSGNVELMNNLTDLFRSPNARSANVGQQLTTVGGGVDVPICLNTSYAAPCSISQPSCQIEYKLAPLSTGVYQVSMIPKGNWTGVAATTATQQVTIMVPTGGFQVANLSNLTSGVTYEQTSRFNAPTENSSKDYLVFTLKQLGTTNLPYATDVEVPLFSFTNSGTCTTGNIELMNNLTDPFRVTNSVSANVGQQLTTVGGGVDVAICLNTSYRTPCASSLRLAGDCVISNEINLTVVPKPVVDVSVPNNTICVGGNVTLAATITGGVGCTVQWQSSPQAPNNWIDIPSAVSNTYTTPSLSTTLKYRTRLICTGVGCCN